MKKFGKKGINSKARQETNEGFFDFSSEYSSYDSELSKKLKTSNLSSNPSDENKDTWNTTFNGFQGKFKQNTIQSKTKLGHDRNDDFTAQPSYVASPHNKPKNFKRLSELEDNNLYFALNLEENCTQEEIKRAYRQKCMLHHPDKGGDPEQFKKIDRAYKILSHEFGRKLYDQFASQAMNVIELILTQQNFEFDRTMHFEDLDMLKLFFQMNKSSN